LELHLLVCLAPAIQRSSFAVFHSSHVSSNAFPARGGRYTKDGWLAPAKRKRRGRRLWYVPVMPERDVEARATCL
jgi:hypothetical protein